MTSPGIPWHPQDMSYFLVFLVLCSTGGKNKTTHQLGASWRRGPNVLGIGWNTENCKSDFATFSGVHPFVPAPWGAWRLPQLVYNICFELLEQHTIMYQHLHVYIFVTRAWPVGGPAPDGAGVGCMLPLSCLLVSQGCCYLYSSKFQTASLPTGPQHHLGLLWA